MAIVSCLAFPGNAADVLAYYHGILGGELSIVRFSETPSKDDVPVAYHDNVCWGALHSPYGSVNVMDPPPGRDANVGQNCLLAIEAHDETEGERIFTRLMENGDVFQAWGPSFFARKFGMGEDRFGIRWIVSIPLAQPVPA